MKEVKICISCREDMLQAYVIDKLIVYACMSVYCPRFGLLSMATEIQKGQKGINRKKVVIDL